MKEDPASFGDPIEPAAIPFSLDAPGWYAVGALLLLIAIALAILLIRRHKRNRYRRDALRFVADLERRTEDPNEVVYEVNFLLKRIALRFTPREQIAGLRGGHWLDFLNSNPGRELFQKDGTIDLIYTRKVDKL